MYTKMRKQELFSHLCNKDGKVTDSLTIKT